MSRGLCCYSFRGCWLCGYVVTHVMGGADVSIAMEVTVLVVATPLVEARPVSLSLIMKYRPHKKPVLTLSKPPIMTFAALSTSC